MNYMEQIAQMLGVELGEKFDILDGDGKIYDKNMKLTENGLLHGESIQSLPFLLVSILTGNMEIKKRSWHPKSNEPYYYIDSEGDIVFTHWAGVEEDYLLYKMSNIYCTEAEAELHKAEHLAFWQNIREEVGE